MQSFADSIKSERGVYLSRLSVEQVRHIDDLMQKAGSGNDVSREELIKVVTPYAERIVGKVFANTFGLENKSLVQKESSAIVDSLLRKDNYQITFESTDGKWDNLRRVIYQRVRQKFSTGKNSQQSLVEGEEQEFLHNSRYRFNKEEKHHIHKFIEEINAGNDDARGKLIGIMKPYVEFSAKRIAREFIGDGEVNADMISEAVTNALYSALPSRDRRIAPLQINGIERNINQRLYRKLSTVMEQQEMSRAAEIEFARQSLPSSRQSSFDLSNPSNNPEKDLEIKRARAMLNDILEPLPPDQRAVLEYRYLEGVWERVRLQRSLDAATRI